MQKALVSIVITTYRRPLQILRRALESAINQTYDNIEVIIVNDFPEDVNMSERIRELTTLYMRNVKYRSMKQNSGACEARNMGIEEAQGEYIAFLDDDDEWFANKIETQLLGFAESRIGLSYTPFYRNDGKIRKLSCDEGKNGNMLEYMLHKNPMALFPLFRVEKIREIGGFDTNLKSSQDHDLILRLAEVCDFAYIDVATANYNVSEESISTNIKNKIDGFNYFMKKHNNLYKVYPNAYYYQMIKMCNNMLTAGYKSEGFFYWRAAIKVKPINIRNILEPTKGVIKRLQRRRPFH
ncbi:glycosyltransferase involved in cell wall biosynthesis [Lachnospiraceae bacterium PF1-21]|uniref:glycosyltransferase family 2 protein n=1 Tax=Ohessyouella blattaphilus TaxID=2949333 RepID=UPI003E1AE1E1